MEMIIVLVIGLVLLWCGYKMVKFVAKLIVWAVVVLILLGAFCYYFDTPPLRHKRQLTRHAYNN